MDKKEILKLPVYKNQIDKYLTKKDISNYETQTMAYLFYLLIT